MSLTLRESIGFNQGQAISEEEKRRLVEFVNLKLAARGFPIVGDEKDYPFLEMGKSLISNFQERSRLLADYLCPSDKAIDAYLRRTLGSLVAEILPGRTSLLPHQPLILERHGIARVLSLPPDQDTFQSDILTSRRVAQGVCHNPASDRRTTAGVFHVAEGGLPIPADKKSVPLRTFAHLLKAALHPPDSANIVPFTSTIDEPVRSFVSLLVRPLVSPEVPGKSPARYSEIRFFAPGNLVCNLDFVESISGNGGDPSLPENDMRLDPRHWSGHTGCVILAPHLPTLRKVDLGLPHVEEATDRQKRDGMCWANEDELYNDGGAFKITSRDRSGCVVTLIADNYFGYCKKEVKTQLSFAANLMGQAEEEHAGGTIALPCADLGERFQLNEYNAPVDHTWTEVVGRYGAFFDLHPAGYAVDRKFPNVIYVPESADFNLHSLTVKWTNAEGEQSLDLQPAHTYILPSGYKVEMVKPSQAQRWRLIGTNAEGTFCHKPCTVSGGGKSEISKSLTDAMISGPVITTDFQRDLKMALEVIHRDYDGRYQNPREPGKPSRPLLSPERSFGSVIRLLTPREEYTPEYNEWLASVPNTVKELVFIIKRHYKPDWEDDWPTRFTVDQINNQPGYQLKYRKSKLVTQYLRVGYSGDGAWRTFGLRKDFSPAFKLQTEDDISAAVVLPAKDLDGLHPALHAHSYKFIQNCEYRLFQRPDEAIHRGYDKNTEADYAQPDNFFSNYEPLDRETVRKMTKDVIRFEQFTLPMQQRLLDFVNSEKPDFVISSAHPRMVNGKPSENPRYLQTRMDLVHPRTAYLVELGARLYRRLPADAPVRFPVTATLPGRRNNPAQPEKGIRPLAVFGPIHYQELPELFMDYIASLTGKSPSTTGAGSEGALTKGPFNALLPIHDLNNALVSYILTQQHGFNTSAGYIGRKYRVDHDISMVVPEIWSRMFLHEREPEYLIKNGFLEPLQDFEHGGKTVPASRLGWRINEAFVSTFFNRMFSNPSSVFTEDMLRPELQNIDDFVDGIANIVETQQKVALQYYEDGSIERACPPLRILLGIMAHGECEGMTAASPAFRAMFTLEALLESNWYRARLERYAMNQKAHLERSIPYVEAFLNNPHYQRIATRLGVAERLKRIQSRLEEIEDGGFVNSLFGTLGADHIR